ncbi:MAG: metal ABC transporter substrate-binding protein [Ilumatobacteraceae bacterium]
MRSRVDSPVLAGLALAGLSLLVSCGSDTDPGSSGSSGPSVVVTHELLASVVRDLVGGSAVVTVLMPNGADPHDWEPSAKDIETLNAADFVVANGLDLEAGLVEALRAAEGDGIPMFHATDHIDVLEAEHHEGEENGHADGEEVDAPEEDADGHDHGDGDPHFWTDPLAMADIVEPLAVALSGVGIDVSERANELVAELRDLDHEVGTALDEIRDDRRKLVTGHESLGYFAAHYDFELVGAVIPSLTTAADVSAADLADLREAIEDTGVGVIFTESGTPSEVVDALADEVGLPVVELATHLLPDDGSYRTFMLDLASDVVEGITA